MKYGRFTVLNIPKCEHLHSLYVRSGFWWFLPWDGWEIYKVLKRTWLAFKLFAMNLTPARWVIPPWDVYMTNCHPGWQGYPTWQTGQPTLVGYPTYHVNVVKIKWEIIWKGGLPHLGDYLTHPGSPNSM